MTDPILCLNLLLDDSGSMASVAPATISGFNEFVNAQEAAPGKVFFTLSTFSSPDAFDTPHKMASLDQVRRLHPDTYHPNGHSTALFDGISDFLDVVEQNYAVIELQSPADAVIDVMCVILTDGGENSSRSHTKKDIFDRINVLTNDRHWNFVYLGANQDAYDVGAGLGVAAGNTRTYAGTVAGTTAAFTATTNSSLQYRAKRLKGVTGQSVVNFFEDEPEILTGEEDEKKPGLTNP